MASAQADKPRFHYYDNLKLALIVLVVVGHFADVTGIVKDHAMARSLFLFIYSFHMPLFLFVSGLFTKHLLPDSKLRIDKVVAFCIIGFGMKILIYVVRDFCRGSAEFSLLSEFHVPWYMFAMAAFTVLVWLFRGIDWRVLLPANIVLALFVGLDPEIGDFLYLSRIIVFFPFFYVGYLLDPAKVCEFVKRPACRIVGALVLVVAVVMSLMYIDVLYPMRYVFTGRISYDSLAYWGIWLQHRLVGYVIAVVMGLAVMSMIPLRKLPVLSEMGTRTLAVYAFHVPVIYVLEWLGVQDACLAIPHGWLLWILLGVVVALVLSLKPFMVPFAPILNCGKVREPR